MAANALGTGGEAERFAFGANWTRFLGLLSEQRILQAEASLREMLGLETLQGRTFLDIGSGSGLFSLAARRLGARVHSFDFDRASVACTAELKRRYFPDDSRWTVEHGSVLDEDYVRRLGTFDVVYSWGVLHHTGEMWRALRIASWPVAPSGRLLVSIYNRRGPLRHRVILGMKRRYVRSGRIVRAALLAGYFCCAIATDWLLELASGRSPLPSIRRYFGESTRGMSWWYDLVDWVGGYPYEAARADEVFALYRGLGLQLEKLALGEGYACNQFLFIAPPAPASAPSR